MVYSLKERVSTISVLDPQRVFFVLLRCVLPAFVGFESRRQTEEDLDPWTEDRAKSSQPSAMSLAEAEEECRELKEDSLARLSRQSHADSRVPVIVRARDLR
jgi:hypothetical protein